MKRELTLAELEALIIKGAVTRKEIQKTYLEYAAKSIKEEAQSMFGHENPEWDPLQESTIERKKAGGYDTPEDLIREGELMNSIETHTEIDARGSEAVVYCKDMGVVVDSDRNQHDFSEYAIVHEITGDAENGTPPRPFLASALMRKFPEIKREARCLCYFFDTDKARVVVKNLVNSKVSSKENT